jgi:Ca2+-binding EF-hand superfamily protein
MISSISGSSSLIQSYMMQIRQQMFNKIDTDGDGKHSKEEISAMLANGPQGGPGVDEIFSRADTDGDGYISQTEFEADSPPDRQMQGSGFGGMASVSSAEFLQQMFNKIDTDGDGKHSKEEISAMLANGPQGGPGVDEIFSRADTDGDGYISQTEFEADQASMQQNGPGQTDSTAQGSDTFDSMVKTLLEVLDDAAQSSASTAGGESQTGTSIAGIAQLLSDALKSYIQSSTNGFSQGNFAEGLLGSSLYV